MRLATALLALLLWLPLATQAQPLAPIPALDSPVVDTTGTLGHAEAGAGAAGDRAAAAQGQPAAGAGGARTQPEDIAQYTTRVFDQWQIGRKGVDDGVLLVVAKDDRRVRRQATALKARFPMPSPTGSSRNTWSRASAAATMPAASPMPRRCWSS
jgi:uncharacterized protein